MPIDFDTLSELQEIMEDDFDELIAMFISDGQTQIDNLRLALEAENIEDARRFAHTLKGSSANIGINILSESCRVLEHQAAEGSLDGSDELLEKIILNYEEAKKILEEKF